MLLDRQLFMVAIAIMAIYSVATSFKTTTLQQRVEQLNHWADKYSLPHCCPAECTNLSDEQIKQKMICAKAGIKL